MAIYGGKILKLGKSHSFSLRNHLQLADFDVLIFVKNVPPYSIDMCAI